MHEIKNKPYSREELLIQLVLGGGDMYGYRIRDRKGFFSELNITRYNMPAQVDNLPQWMVDIGSVGEESIKDWFALFDAIDRGEKHGSARVSLKRKPGVFGRFWLRFDSFADEEGTPVFATISYEDILQEYEQTRLQAQDISALLQATQKVFPEILTVNLTKGTYHMISYHKGTSLDTPREGQIDDMIDIRLGGVIEEDRESFKETFSYAALKDAFICQGRDTLVLAYRRPGRDEGVYWFETTVMRQNNEMDEDVLLVAVSRNIDAQKAEEIRLQEQLRLQAEEIRVTTGRMRRTICYYDIATKALTVPADYAREHRMPQTILNYPDCLNVDTKGGLTETLEGIHKFYDAILRGEPDGTCELAFQHPQKGMLWKRWEYVLIHDRKGEPKRAIIYVDDITSQRLQATENQKLKENEQILRLIAQHSDRVICHYDIQEKKAQVWDKETCANCQLPRLCQQSPQKVLEGGNILQESRDEVRAMFRDIHNGAPGGAIKMHVKTPNGENRWFDMRYSTIFDENSMPVSALISHKDITTEYEHELAYLRHAQSLKESKHHLGVLEVDLDTDIIETQGGRLMPPGTTAVGRTLTEFGAKMIAIKMLKEDQLDGQRFFSAEYLGAQYTAGIRQMSRVWQMHFRDGGLGWVRTEVDLMPDPYTNHRKAFFCMTDITEEKKAQLEAQTRSERDGMTGLFNRATAVERIQKQIAEKQSAGILILLDLDDLKGINDTFGHAEGDRAILGIAETLKVHFRESDIIGRIGGDEFMVWLPGAAENKDTIAASLSGLLRKLTGIPIGTDNKRRIHCSIGCAVQTLEVHTFEDLYKEADVALYHVKRSGKNNYAFYSPDMTQEDYEFQAQRLLSLQTEKKFEMKDLQYLLTAISEFYQLVMSMNLSTNDYFLMEEVRDGVFSKLPSYGVMDDFVTLTGKNVHPGDVSEYMEHLSREALLQAYARGETSVRCYFRFRVGDEYRWTETDVIFYTNTNGDVCDFTLVRWADERAHELNQLWVNKVLELAVKHAFEYIALVDIRSGEYSLYGDRQNTHGVPHKGNFDEVTRMIRDHSIRPEEQDTYYEKAKLEHIREQMEEKDGYTYRYQMPDGEREANFHWFEPTHTQVLMVIQRK